MKESRTILATLLVFLILIFSGILFLPMFIVYGGFGLLDPFAVKERYSLEYYIYLESYEPFENLTLLVPTAKLGSMELIPTNAETVKIDNQTYVKLNQNKPFSEMRRLWRENKTIIVYRMDFTVKLSKIKIKNPNKYGIDDGDVKVFLNYTNASHVKLHIVLYYLEFDYVVIFGKRLYTNFGHYNYPWCETVPVNITEKERGKWIKVPVMCSSYNT